MTLQSAAVSVPLSFAGIGGGGSSEHAKVPSDGSKVASTDSSWGIGGGGETMLQQDMNIMRVEMIGTRNFVFSDFKCLIVCLQNALSTSSSLRQASE
jgi:hypothetical protein